MSPGHQVVHAGLSTSKKFKPAALSRWSMTSTAEAVLPASLKQRSCLSQECRLRQISLFKSVAVLHKINTMFVKIVVQLKFAGENSHRKQLLVCDLFLCPTRITFAFICWQFRMVVLFSFLVQNKNETKIFHLLRPNKAPFICEVNC